MPSVVIRNAVAADAQAACEVMRRSIAELCDADHHNDPKILTAWLGNKQPRIFHAWLAEPDNSVLVAVDGDRIVSVGAVRDSGETVLISVPSIPGRTYRLEHKNALGDSSWEPLGNDAVADGPTLTFIDGTVANGQRFYRVVLVQ